MHGFKILLVEDNEDISFLVKAGLEREGADVCAEITAEDALNLIKKKWRPDIILLDIMLPAQSGIEALPKFKNLCDATIIIISAKSSLRDKITGLDQGADDYIAKPFEMAELVSRINAHIRRDKQKKSFYQTQDIPFHNWTLRPSQFQAYDNKGRSAQLTLQEYRLLEVLALSPNMVFSREKLLEKTRFDFDDTSDRAIDAQISRIRKKLGDTGMPYLIKPVRGVGYTALPERKSKNV